MTDNTADSFLFSLTKNHKFTLVDKEKAIRSKINYGPIFGNGRDLLIANKANKNTSSWSNVNVSYKNDECTTIHGSPIGDHFKIKEWEVWKL